jgi:predicted solute-binding protein
VTSFYVYYRVEPDRLPALRADIGRLFSTIEGATGVRGRWMRRRDDPATYMEVYESVRDERSFEALLEREAAALGLQRRVECFVCA